MAINKVLKVANDTELMSFIINSNPILSSELDLPRQGESIKPIGKLILNSERLRNAFINTVNLIGITVIKRNYWENPWNFTKKGEISYGSTVREIITDLVKAHDYHKNFTDKTRFLKTFIPDVYNFFHEVNYQKFYESTTSYANLRMAFDSEGSLMNFIEECMQINQESYKYDVYVIDKYMLCKRIVDGTITSVQLENYETTTAREKLTKIKTISNDMTFRNRNFNPAGLRLATSFDRQIAIIDTNFEAEVTTTVLATSYFKNEAEMKAGTALIDGFANHDTDRLQSTLEEGYIPFTAEELETLKNVPCILIDRDNFFMDYEYALDNTAKNSQVFNNTTLETNIYLHAWRVFSTSPFAQACVFTKDSVAVTNVEINPSEMSVSAGQTVQLTATVSTTGFANKAVIWSVEQATGQVTPVTVDLNGKVTIPSDFQVSAQESAHIVIKATSVFDNTKTATASITVL